MAQQEAIMIDYEKKNPVILRPTAKKAKEKKEDGEKKSSGGVFNKYSIKLKSVFLLSQNKMCLENLDNEVINNHIKIIQILLDFSNITMFMMLQKKF